MMDLPLVPKQERSGATKTSRAKAVAKYVLLPGFIPRLKEFKLNFGYLAYLMALVFEQARLIPAGHLYLNPTMMGRFGFKDILGLAAHNLRPGWRNSDQYVIFGMFLLGIVLLVLQFCLLAGLLLTNAAHAAASPTGMSAVPFTSIFATGLPEHDIALMMLDRVFGVPGLLGSEFSPTSASQITPFTLGLQSLFEFYSWGMLFVAGIIVMYYTFVVVAETVQTGTPFGKRFANVYAPIRLCIAVLLMLPVAYGYNVGQHITLNVAKWGSGLATNSWLVFVQSLSNPLGLGEKDLLAAPKVAEIDPVLKFFTLAQTCRAAYEQKENKIIQPYLVRSRGADQNANSIPLDGLTFDNALEFSQFQDIYIRFGEKGDQFTRDPNAKGNVYPYCGEVIMRVKALDKITIPLYREYFSLLASLWKSPSLAGFGERWAANNLYNTQRGCDINVGPYPWPEDRCSEDAEPAYMFDFHEQTQTVFDNNLRVAIEEVRDLNVAYLQSDEDLRSRGWGGAGIWFNRIAQTNGVLVSAAYSMPEISLYPDVLEQTMGARNAQEGKDAASGTCFRSKMASMFPMRRQGLQGTDTEITKTLDSVCRYFQKTRAADGKVPEASGNVIIDMMKGIFGMEALFSLRDHEEIHPLAQMSAMGRAIIDNSIRFMSAGSGTAIFSNFISTLDLYPDDPQKSDAISAHLKKGGSMLSGFMFTLAFTGLSAGFILYYMIPFLPFIYFFFGVGRWVKSIFEAMVGIPLWALAHLRIDGEGIPAQAAANGYFLLLEIMLRPILTLFGMMAAISIFTALASMMNMMFDIATENLTGHEAVSTAGGGVVDGLLESFRGPIDQLFYTLLYAILLYMMAMSCFKLIDSIPNGTLRWIGAGVNSFGDKMPDVGQNMTNYAAIAGGMYGNKLGDAANQLSTGVGQAAGMPFTIEKAMRRRANQADDAGGGGGAE